MRLDLVDLRLFVQIANSGSITQGAKRANMALASASERVRGMEADVGVALLARGRRGISLTPAGHALAHHAQVVLQQCEHMRSELGRYAHGVKGCVRMLANTSALAEFLPDVLNGFLAENRNIDIDLEERASFDIVRAVAEGFADIGIVADIVDFEGLESFHFATDQLVVVTPRTHSLARRRRVAFRDLLSEEIVGMSADHALQDHISRHAIQAGRPLKVRIRLSSFEGVCRMVEKGIGLAVVPESAALRYGQSMAISNLRLTDNWALRRLYVCVRDLERLPKPAQQLVHHLRQHATEEGRVPDRVAGRARQNSNSRTIRSKRALI